MRRHIYYDVKMHMPPDQKYLFFFCVDHLDHDQFFIARCSCVNFMFIAS